MIHTQHKTTMLQGHIRPGRLLVWKYTGRPVPGVPVFGHRSSHTTIFLRVLMLSGIPIIATLQNDYPGDKILKARNRDFRGSTAVSLYICRCRAFAAAFGQYIAVALLLFAAGCSRQRCAPVVGCACVYGVARLF